MRATGNQAPLNDLLRFRDWAKNAASEFLRNDEFAKVKLSMEILELSEELEKKLGTLLEAETTSSLEQEGVEEPEIEEEQGYPAFFIRGDFLVKQGKTRDKRDIYEQKLRGLNLNV